LKRGNRNKTNFQLKGRIVVFATNNINKFNEARRILAEHKIAVGMFKVKAAEIQSDSLKKIAQTSAQDAFRRCHLPILVEDAGLFIKALNGFPGPYAAYVYETLGNKGLLKLMKNVKDRKARFKSAIAYCESREDVSVCFEGEANGEITVNECSEKGKASFGFDPIFRPSGSIKTFAQMTIEEKNGFSHRAKGFRKFAEWFKKLQ